MHQLKFRIRPRHKSQLAKRKIRAQLDNLNKIAKWEADIKDLPIQAK